MFRVFYRMSDAANPLGQTPHALKVIEIMGKVERKHCFKNFISVFSVDDMTVFADNVTDETIDFLNKYKVNEIVRTNLGNTKSFMLLINKAIAEYNDDDIIYVAEDDYFHLPNVQQLLIEGLEVGHYATVFDHPDKYDDNAGNPFIHGGGEVTKLVTTKSTHWKYTNATTGTLAFKVKTIKEDYDIIAQNCQEHHPFPQDFAMCQELINRKKRIIVSSIPGRSSHVGLVMSPFVDWKLIAEKYRNEN